MGAPFEYYIVPAPRWPREPRAPAEEIVPPGTPGRRALLSGRAVGVYTVSRLQGVMAIHRLRHPPYYYYKSIYPFSPEYEGEHLVLSPLLVHGITVEDVILDNIEARAEYIAEYRVPGRPAAARHYSYLYSGIVEALTAPGRWVVLPPASTGPPWGGAVEIMLEMRARPAGLLSRLLPWRRLKVKVPIIRYAPWEPWDAGVEAVEPGPPHPWPPAPLEFFVYQPASRAAGRLGTLEPARKARWIHVLAVADRGGVHLSEKGARAALEGAAQDARLLARALEEVQAPGG